MRLHLIEYDIKTLQYVLRTEPIRFPSAGLHRNHHAAVKGGSGGNILSGTAAGELIVINEVGRLFRASLPVTSNGMLSLLSIGDDVCVHLSPLPFSPFLFHVRTLRYSGSGDGCIKRLSGSDMHWQATGEALVVGKVTSLAAAVSGNHLFAGTDAGCM